MKKIFILSLLVIFALSFVSFADAATKARTASVAQGLQGAYGIADLSSGDSAEVDSDGRLAVANTVNSTAVSLGATSNAVITGACTVKGFITKGVSAGDYALVYDALTVTGSPKFDIYVGTAADTKVVTLPEGGVAFATGVTIASTDADVVTTVIYN